MRTDLRALVGVEEALEQRAEDGRVYLAPVEAGGRLQQAAAARSVSATGFHFAMNCWGVIRRGLPISQLSEARPRRTALLICHVQALAERAAEAVPPDFGAGRGRPHPKSCRPAPRPPHRRIGCRNVKFDRSWRLYLSLAHSIQRQ